MAVFWWLYFTPIAFNALLISSSSTTGRGSEVDLAISNNQNEDALYRRQTGARPGHGVDSTNCHKPIRKIKLSTTNLLFPAFHIYLMGEIFICELLVQLSSCHVRQSPIKFRNISFLDLE